MYFKVNKLFSAITFMLCVIEVTNISVNAKSENKMFIGYPCKGNAEIVSIFNKGVRKGYLVTIIKELEAMTQIQVKLDSVATIAFGGNFDTSSDDAILTEKDLINNVHAFILRKPENTFTFIVKGRHAPEHPPYMLSLKINGEEHCYNPDRTYFGRHKTGIKELWPAAPDKFCGRRRINRDYTELIVSGTKSELGNWPWHVALHRKTRLCFEYICGGTLISKFTVLTAAHCVTSNQVPVNPETLKVVFGRTSLFNIELYTQERMIHQITIHDDFDRLNLDHDIALLKMGAEVIFNNYIQPACLWLDAAYDRLGTFDVMGTVVGWGIDQTETLSNQLQESSFPIASKLSCVEYNPTFYVSILSNGKKFCAGFNNGTAPCNGDSGGGYMVFVPDTRDPSYAIEYKTGAWYVRGIVSVTLTKPGTSICEPNAYTVFTDVAKYRNWILNYMMK